MAKRKPSLYARMRKQLRRDIHQPSVMSCEDVYSIAWASGYRAGQRDEQAKAKQIIDIAYRMARHIRNTDSTSAPGWGFGGVKLLDELREMNAKAYNAKVKKARKP